MSKRDLVARELAGLPEQDLDRIIVFLSALKREQEEGGTLLAAESALAKDWLTEEEEAAWASL